MNSQQPRIRYSSLVEQDQTTLEMVNSMPLAPSLETELGSVIGVASYQPPAGLGFKPYLLVFTSCPEGEAPPSGLVNQSATLDRKSTRLNSSHSQISYAVFCLKKKKNRSTQH